MVALVAMAAGAAPTAFLVVYLAGEQPDALLAPGVLYAPIVTACFLIWLKTRRATSGVLPIAWAAVAVAIVLAVLSSPSIGLFYFPAAGLAGGAAALASTGE